MLNKYPNKLFNKFAFIVYVLFGVIFLTLFVLQNKPHTITTAEYISQDIKKITNDEYKIALFSLNVVLVGNLDFDSNTNTATGHYFFANDPEKNVFTFSQVMNGDGQLRVGYFISNPLQTKRWEMRDKNGYSLIVKDGASVNLVASLQLNNPQDKYDFDVIDNALSGVQKANEKNIKIPDDFIFKVSSINFQIDN